MHCFWRLLITSTSNPLPTGWVYSLSMGHIQGKCQAYSSWCLNNLLHIVNTVFPNFQKRFGRTLFYCYPAGQPITTDIFILYVELQRLPLNSVWSLAVARFLSLWVYDKQNILLLQINCPLGLLFFTCWSFADNYYNVK